MLSRRLEPMRRAHRIEVRPRRIAPGAFRFLDRSTRVPAKRGEHVLALRGRKDVGSETHARRTIRNDLRGLAIAELVHRTVQRAGVSAYREARSSGDGPDDGNRSGCRSTG